MKGRQDKPSLIGDETVDITIISFSGHAFSTIKHTDSSNIHRMGLVTGHKDIESSLIPQHF